MAPNTPDPFPNQTGKPIWFDAKWPAMDDNTSRDIGYYTNDSGPVHKTPQPVSQEAGRVR